MIGESQRSCWQRAAVAARLCVRSGRFSCCCAPVPPAMAKLIEHNSRAEQPGLLAAWSLDPLGRLVVVVVALMGLAGLAYAMHSELWGSTPKRPMIGHEGTVHVSCPASSVSVYPSCQAYGRGEAHAPNAERPPATLDLRLPKVGFRTALQPKAGSGGLPVGLVNSVACCRPSLWHDAEQLTRNATAASAPQEGHGEHSGRFCSHFGFHSATCVSTFLASEAEQVEDHGRH